MKVYKNHFTLKLVKWNSEEYSMEKLNSKIIEMLTKAFDHVLIFDGTKTTLKKFKPEKQEILIVKCYFNESTPKLQEVLQQAILLEMTQAKEDTVELSYNGELQVLYKKDYINYK